MNNILGEHPTFSGKPTYVITNENQETNNLYLNKLNNLKSQQKHVNSEENSMINKIRSYLRVLPFYELLSRQIF